MVTGNVTGNSYVGLVTGAGNYAARIVGMGNVTGTEKLGGLIGGTCQNLYGGVYLGGTITGTGGNIGPILGIKTYGCTYDNTITSKASSTSIINGTAITDGVEATTLATIAPYNELGFNNSTLYTWYINESTGMIDFKIK